MIRFSSSNYVGCIFYTPVSHHNAAQASKYVWMLELMQHMMRIGSEKNTPNQAMQLPAIVGLGAVDDQAMQLPAIVGLRAADKPTIQLPAIVGLGLLTSQRCS
jgi:hypothetical protein